MNRTPVVRLLLTLVITFLLLGTISTGVYAWEEMVREYDEDDKYGSPDPDAERFQTMVVTLVVLFIVIAAIKFISDENSSKN